MRWIQGVATPASHRSSKCVVAVAALLAIYAASAQTEEPVSPDPTPTPAPSAAHQHGVARLKVMVQGQRLAFEFDSAAIDVIGFERAPQSDAEQRKVSYARGQLQQAPRLFITSPGANCRLVSVKVDEPTWDDAGEHQDYRARYVFLCQRPQLLQAIDVRLVNQLAPGTRLQARVMVGNTKRTLELVDNRNTIRIPE